MEKNTTLEISGKQLPVTNLNKIFYPKTGFTKGEMMDYYIKISNVLLPHLKDRPISLKRYPEGVEDFFFYEKRCPRHRPEWVKTVCIERTQGEEIHYCVINSLETLVWASNLANLELHTFLHKAPAVKRPTAAVFDLDPGAPAEIAHCCQVALRMKKILDGLELKSFSKTSGSKGLQVYVPLNSRTATYEKTKTFARTVAEILEKQFPELVLSQMKKSLRKGKVFIDWSQNDEKKTTVNVYSLRAQDHPTVSAPVTWKEVQKAAEEKSNLSFESSEVLKRVDKMGDLFAPVITLKQKLPLLNSPDDNGQFSFRKSEWTDLLTRAGKGTSRNR